MHESHPSDVKLLRPRQRLLINPILICGVIFVNLRLWELLWVLDKVCVQDAMGSITWRFGNGAERHCLLRREEVKGALEACADTRVDDADVTSETFRAPIDERDDRAGRGKGSTQESTRPTRPTK